MTSLGGRLVVTNALGRTTVDLANPELSPTEAVLDGLPPVHLRVGTDEIFLPDIEIYHQRLVDVGVQVDYHVEDGGIHVYPTIVGADEARRAIDSQVTFLRAQLSTP